MKKEIGSTTLSITINKNEHGNKGNRHVSLDYAFTGELAERIADFILDALEHMESAKCEEEPCGSSLTKRKQAKKK